MHRHRGFTLIELLVVIAVIALIAAILFPVFAQAREKARQATCLAQAKQCGMAIGMYEQDYDEVVTPCFLYHRHWSQGDPILYWWEDLVQPYVKNSSVFVCPNRSNPNYTFGRSTFPPGEGAERRNLRFSMACNDWQANRSGFWANYQFEALGPMVPIYGVGRPVTIRVAAIEEPANTILLADAADIELWNARCHQDWLPDDQRPFATVRERDDPYWGRVRGLVNLRHHGGFTAIFADNHAKWLKRTTGPDMWSIRKGVRLIGGNGCEDLVQ